MTKVKVFDFAIIGGGIVGSGLFRDHSLHNKSSIILDKHDFNSQTSQGSSKMLHGGIRYLENLDFGLIAEALYEKNLWLRLAPHITKELPFYLPVYKESKWPLFFMRAGLFLYDALSLFKNSPHKVLNIKKTLESLPGLKKEGLTGCGLYHDGIVDDAKLGLECIYDGLLNPACEARNYSEVVSYEKENDHFKIEVLNTIENSTSYVLAKNLIIATGPFTDQVMHKLNIPWQDIILPSKGIHLWLKKDALKIKDAMVLQTKDNRVIFVIPQRNAILVGTTEDPLDPKANLENLKVTEDEIEYILKEVKNYFPENKITQEHIISHFAGVRPLVRDGHKSAKISRKHKVFNPSENVYVIAGGKYTTFRAMAQDLNKKVFKNNNWKYDKSLTLNPLRKTSVIENPFENKISVESIERILKEESVKTKEDLIERRLSLQSLEHLNDREIIEHIKKMRLP